MCVFGEIMGGGTCSYSIAVPGASSMSGMEIGFPSNPPLSDHQRHTLLCDCLPLTDMKPPLLPQLVCCYLYTGWKILTVFSMFARDFCYVGDMLYHSASLNTHCSVFHELLC